MDNIGRTFLRIKRSVISRNKESEKDTEKYLNKVIEQYGGVTYKWSSPNNRAVPDRICILPDHPIIFVEVKSEGEDLSKLQAILHQKLKIFTDHVYVVDSKAAVDKLVYLLIPRKFVYSSMSSFEYTKEINRTGLLRKENILRASTCSLESNTR